MVTKYKQITPSKLNKTKNTFFFTCNNHEKHFRETEKINKFPSFLLCNYKCSGCNIVFDIKIHFNEFWPDFLKTSLANYPKYQYSNSI